MMQVDVEMKLQNMQNLQIMQNRSKQSMAGSVVPLAMFFT